MINIIVAVGNHIPDKGWPMGRNGAMPWNNKADLKWFKDTTTGHPVVMGRKTYEAIGHPLKNRTNIVVTTRDDMWAENAGVRVYGNLEDALKFAKTIDEEVFIIGGSSICNYALQINNLNCKSRPVVGYVTFYGINLCNVLKALAPQEWKNFVKDHDFVELELKDNIIFFDASLYDYYIDCTTIISK